MPTLNLLAFEKVLLGKVIRSNDQLSYFISCCFKISFYISRDHLYNFLELDSELSKKDFHRKFYFFNGFRQLP